MTSRKSVIHFMGAAKECPVVVAVPCRAQWDPQVLQDTRAHKVSREFQGQEDLQAFQGLMVTKDQEVSTTLAYYTPEQYCISHNEY